MKRKDYGQSVVMVRVLEKKLLTKNKLDRMIEAETPEEVMKQLSETEYSQNMFEVVYTLFFHSIVSSIGLDCMLLVLLPVHSL